MNELKIDQGTLHFSLNGLPSSAEDLARAGIALEFILERDEKFGVVECMATFTNSSAEKITPTISEIFFEIEFPLGEGAPKLWHGTGDRHDEFNYSFETVTIPMSATLDFFPDGGRPSDPCDHVFPYFRVYEEGAGGYAVAVGWPAAWRGTWTHRPGKVLFRAGQKEINTVLLPGETIRTPRLTFLPFESIDEAPNAWRRWFREKILPREPAPGFAGETARPLQPRLCGQHTTPCGDEFSDETEESQIAAIRAAREKLGLHFKNWWIDAGWYPNNNDTPPIALDGSGADNWWSQQNRSWFFVGDWRPDPVRFPRGLAPIADELAKQDDAGLLLWFEPERTFREHTSFPSCALTPSVTKSHYIRMLRMDDHEVTKFLAEHIDRTIKENKVRVYREDFNFDIAPYFALVDAESSAANGNRLRKGITENKHVQEHLWFWRYLRAHNPGLWIDSCASGGRRNDLESLRCGAVPLHYSDFGYTAYNEKPRYHQIVYEWFLYCKDTCAGLGHVEVAKDEYPFATSMAPFYVFRFCGYDYPPEEFERRLRLEKKFIDWFEALAPFMVDGDFYQLTDVQRGIRRSWDAKQFHDPQTGHGAIFVIRGEESPDETLEIVPRKMSAAFTVTLPPRGAKLITY